MAPAILGIFFFGSINLIGIGILAEYIGAIYTQILRRDLVRESTRLNEDALVSPTALIKGSRFLRFLATGVINTGFGYAIFALLIWAGLDYLIAAPFSFLIGTLFNYFSNRYLVFFTRGLSVRCCGFVSFTDSC